MAFTKITNAGFGLTTGTLVGVAASFSSTVSVGGTLTYEDVTNVDSVGLITARNGIEVTDKGVQVGTGATVDSAGDNILTFLTNGNERIRVTSDGKVGINTDMGGAPASLYPFSVYRSTGTGYVYTETAQSGASAGLRAKAGTADFTIFTTQGTGQLAVYDNTNSAERLRIDSSGRLLKSGQASLTSTSLNHPIQVAAASDANAAAIIGRAADDIGELSFYEADKSTKLGELQYRQDHLNLRHRVGGIRFATGGTTERLRITSDGQIRIGSFGAPSNKNTVTPLSHVDGSGVNGGFQVNRHTSVGGGGSQLMLTATRGSSITGHTVLQDGDGIGTVEFAGSDGGEFVSAASIQAQVDGTPGDDDMPGRLIFKTTADGASSPTERMRIINSGKVGINCTIPFSDAELTVGNNGSGNASIAWRRTGSGENDWALSNQGGELKLLGGGDASTISGLSEKVRFQSAGGISFNGDTAAANALDDYEEGTFTPTAQGSTVAGTATYSQQVGKYTKIGERVFFEIYIHWSSGTGSGSALYVYGLPFTVHGGNQSYPATTIGYFHNISFASSSSPGALCASGSTYVYFYAIPNGGGSNAAIAYDSAGAMIISGHYKVN